MNRSSVKLLETSNVFIFEHEQCYRYFETQHNSGLCRAYFVRLSQFHIDLSTTGEIIEEDKVEFYMDFA